MTGNHDSGVGALLTRARERERGQSRAARRAAGQFSTPIPIARALVGWAVTADAGEVAAGDPPPRVLDPAAGGGVFALAVVERLRALVDAGAAGAVDHAAVAERVTAVERDPDAVTQARGHLPDGVTVREADFLACGPGDLGRFDAIVGNPPYVRQEGLDGEARAHLAAFGPDGEAPYLDGDAAIDRRSDAYVYFLTNATRLLRPGGRLAMVIPTKWLATRYGETLQQFLLDHYHLEAVVGFDTPPFDEALVDTGLLCCRRLPETKARVGMAAGPTADPPEAGPTRFCRVDDAGANLEAVLAGRTEPAHQVGVDRSRLEARTPGKVSHLLEAPPLVDDLLEVDALVPLCELATPAYGHKTGANDFFFDPEVDERFRAPALTSFREVDGYVLEEPPATVLDVHGYVRRVADGDTAIDPDTHDSRAAATLAALDAEGFHRTADYLRGGREYAERATCAARAVWFDLGPLTRPSVLHPKFFDARIAVVANRAGCVPGNAIDCLQVADGVATDPLLGALNATLHAVLLECWGRSEGGGALQLMTYELERVPVLDVRALTDAARARLADGFRALAREENGARERLDRAVIDATGLDTTPERLRTVRERLVDRRTGR